MDGCRLVLRLLHIVSIACAINHSSVPLKLIHSGDSVHIDRTNRYVDSLIESQVPVYIYLCLSSRLQQSAVCFSRGTVAYQDSLFLELLIHVICAFVI